MQTLTKRHRQSLTSYVNRCLALIEARKNHIDYLHLEGKVPDNLDDIKQELERLESTLADFQLQIDGNFTPQTEEPAETYELNPTPNRHQLILGERALLELYTEAFPNYFNREQVTDQCYTIEARLSHS